MNDQQYLSSSLGILDAATLASPADVPVYRGMKVTNQEDYDSHYVVGDTVIVKLLRLMSSLTISGRIGVTQRSSVPIRFSM